MNCYRSSLLGIPSVCIATLIESVVLFNILMRSVLVFLQGAFLEKIKSENPGIPCFLFGHSTGGAVALKVSWFNRFSLRFQAR